MLTVHTPAKQKCSPVSCYFSYSAILMAAYRHGPLRERVVKSSSVSRALQVSLSFFHFVLYDTKVGRMKA